MKRKIAILLSAMMVTSAMPITASAAQLKSDSVQNTTFAKSNETIDPNAKDYGTYNDENQLRSRKSVLKIDLKNDSTDNIPAGTSFNVKLTNGTFGNFEAGANMDNAEFKKQFGYRNTNSITYDEVKDLTRLQDVYKKVAGATTAKYALNTPISLEDPEASATVQALKTAFGQATTGSPGTNAPNGNTATDLNTWLNTHKSSAATNFYNEVKSDIEASDKAAPALLHIPYNIELLSPTEARITTLQNMTLSNGDIKVPFNTSANVDVTKLGIKVYNDAECTSEITDYTNTNLNAAKGIKIVELEAGKGLTTTSTNLENPYIALPLGGVIADGNGPVKATVVADYTDKVVGGEYTITKGLDSNTTNLVYDANGVKSFDDKITISSLTLKENVRGTIGKNNEAKITLRLGSGFTFKNPQSITIKDASGANTSLSGNFAYVGSNKSAIEVTVKGLDNRNNPIGLDFGNIEIEPVNDNNYGDVDITVSGDNINTQTVKVAKREKLGFKLETVKDAKEIISGRHYSQDTNGTMTEQDNTTVEVKFSEAVPNTLVSQRALDFTLPEGVKFVSADISNYKGFTKNPTDADSFEIRDNGRTLRLKRDSYTVNGNNTLAEFTMKLNLSVDPGFKGDIKLAVSGGGQSDKVETVIAKAVIPFEIKSQSTKLNLGYQDYNTADIVITEAKPGMFLEGKDATLSLSAPYGTQELGFSDAKFEVSGGELEVKEKDFKVGDYKVAGSSATQKGVINFKINKASYKNPSTITIKNVKVGTTRSVPFGAYDLKLSGEAVINNYTDKIDENKVVALNTAKSQAADGKVNYDLSKQNNTSSYDFKNYVEVITETGTLDKTVKVSVGEKTVLVGDQAIDMDVAPYIQASSNSTMVPLRFVSVALGVDTGNVANPDASNKIAWDANTKTTTIYYGAGTGQKIIQFQAGSNIMTVDGTRIPMEYGVKAEIKDGRMFVPFRALGQALGVAVTWDADSRTAIYNENNARNSNTTTTATTASTTTESTTASTTKESTTESTTASDKTTETTTKKTN